jgi:hypothetical protein
VLSTIGRGSTGGFEAHRGAPVSSAPSSPSFLTTVGKPPRGSRGPDEGDRRSWRVDRNDPGRIRQAPNRSGSGQVGNGPNVTIITVIPDYLLLPVRDVGTHGGQPFQSPPRTG